MKQALLGTRVLMINAWVQFIYKSAARSAHHWGEIRKESGKKQKTLPVACNYQDTLFYVLLFTQPPEDVPEEIHCSELIGQATLVEFPQWRT